ncbi:MAG: hypothetical protein HQM08_23445 [Candidatus Riflebacteria bacterium]|nr:hypothetical protein [Candidatus Riflebacteria bacterium]
MREFGHCRYFLIFHIFSLFLFCLPLLAETKQNLLFIGNWEGKTAIFDPASGTVPTPLWNLPRLIQNVSNHSNESLLFSIGNHYGKMDPVGFLSNGYLESLLEKEIAKVKPFSGFCLSPNDFFLCLDEKGFPKKEFLDRIWTNCSNENNLNCFLPFKKVFSQTGPKFGLGCLISPEKLVSTPFSSGYFALENIERTVNKILIENSDLDIIFFVLYGSIQQAFQIEKKIRENDRIILITNNPSRNHYPDSLISELNWAKATDISKFSENYNSEEVSGKRDDLVSQQVKIEKNHKIIFFPWSEPILMNLTLTKWDDGTFSYDTARLPLGNNTSHLISPDFKTFAKRMERRRNKVLTEVPERPDGTVAPGRMDRHFQAELAKKLFSADLALLEAKISGFLSGGKITRDAILRLVPPDQLRCYKMDGADLSRLISSIFNYPSKNQIEICGAKVEIFAGSIKMSVGNQNLDMAKYYYIVVDEKIFRNHRYAEFLKKSDLIKPIGYTLWDAWEKAF